MSLNPAWSLAEKLSLTDKVILVDLYNSGQSFPIHPNFKDYGARSLMKALRLVAPVRDATKYELQYNFTSLGIEVAVNCKLILKDWLNGDESSG